LGGDPLSPPPLQAASNRMNKTIALLRIEGVGCIAL